MTLLEGGAEIRKELGTYSNTQKILPCSLLQEKELKEFGGLIRSY
ncbi:hypothetical protein [Leptospira stimsonii]|nr:hypothetical protein [Leptospira stimsonii]